MNKLDYEKVFNTLVKETGDYITNNHLQCMVLGISGGIDSTVVAAICHEVSKNTGIPLIGRSLPIRNKKEEYTTANLVGMAFCDNYKVVNLVHNYHSINNKFTDLEGGDYTNLIAHGNIQARLRMIYLYNVSAIHKGLVMSTDNQTEYQLGFWTIHGDVGDFNPIQDLWKTEVYGLANYLFDKYDYWRNPLANDAGGSIWNEKAYQVLKQSIALTPTDGLGISNSDLEQIGAKSYDEVDNILQTLLPIEHWIKQQPDILVVREFNETLDFLYSKYSQEVTDKVWKRHTASEFKRKKAPIYIPRNKYE